jgi:hypothetical protein
MLIRIYACHTTMLMLSACAGADSTHDERVLRSVAPPHGASGNMAGLAGVDSEQERKALTFVRALLSKDLHSLKKYGVTDEFFMPSGKLRPEIHDFLYGKIPGWRSAREIAEDGKLTAVVVPQDDNQVIVIYVSKERKERLKDIEFLQSEWMKQYFACQFDTREDPWKLHMNFCFAETDGPYPPEMK